MQTVQTTAKNGLCISCGICKGVCPRNCITYNRSRGMFQPVIDESACIRCGLCADVCPGLGHRYEPKDTNEESITGPVLLCSTAWSRDPSIRHTGASGGVISSLIPRLLEAGLYDGAFCLDSYDYRSQLHSRLYTPDEVRKLWKTSSAPKSRYLPVSHENAVAYIRENPNARLILVGTSCALRGLDAVIKKYRRNREQYLLIGLFCDKVFNYNVLPYFQDRFCQGQPLEALHFKNKESGGWPGDMKLFPQNSEAFYIPKEERGNAKAWFMPERCLYCVDKLNITADISLGDNYTTTACSSLGSNSVIVRTDRGLSAWSATADIIESIPVELQQILQAQDLTWRLNNLNFSVLKEREMKSHFSLNPGLPVPQRPVDYLAAWHEALKKLNCGADYDCDPQKLQRVRKLLENRGPVRTFAKRVYYYVIRKIR